MPQAVASRRGGVSAEDSVASRGRGQGGGLLLIRGAPPQGVRRIGELQPGQQENS